MRIDNNQGTKWIIKEKENKEIKREESVSIISKRTLKDSYETKITPEEMNRFFELAKSLDVVREDKINEIKKRIEEGTYNVTGKDIINKLMEDKK